MKKFFAIVTSITIVLSGCTFLNSEKGTILESGISSSQEQKVKVVTSFYPLYEIAKQVGGDFVDVKNLVPAGAEPHDYELTPKDISTVYDSQILLVNGTHLEPWFVRIFPDLQQHSKVRVVNESDFFHDVISGDPHIWMDPVQYSREVQNFAKVLNEVDPVHKDYYSVQSERFMAQLADLDRLYQSGLQHCSIREFVTNHAAFGYLAKRYDLQMISIAGFSPDSEPSAKTLVDLVTKLRDENIRYVLTESLVSPKVAQTLAAEVGAQTLVLNPLEGLTDEEISRGKNYITVMEQNLKNLQTAMDCR